MTFFAGGCPVVLRGQLRDRDLRSTPPIRRRSPSASAATTPAFRLTNPTRGPVQLHRDRGQLGKLDGHNRKPPAADRREPGRVRQRGARRRHRRRRVRDRHGRRRVDVVVAGGHRAAERPGSGPVRRPDQLDSVRPHPRPGGVGAPCPGRRGSGLVRHQNGQSGARSRRAPTSPTPSACPERSVASATRGNQRGPQRPAADPHDLRLARIGRRMGVHHAGGGRHRNGELHPTEPGHGRRRPVLHAGRQGRPADAGGHSDRQHGDRELLHRRPDTARQHRLDQHTGDFRPVATRGGSPQYRLDAAQHPPRQRCSRHHLPPTAPGRLRP